MNISPVASAPVPSVRESAPAREREAPNISEAPTPKRGQRDEYVPSAKTATYNTDKVDREIEKLRKELAEAKARAQQETDPRKAGEWDRKVSRLENELRQKDQDSYRRQHADVS